MGMFDFLKKTEPVKPIINKAVDEKNAALAEVYEMQYGKKPEVTKKVDNKFYGHYHINKEKTKILVSSPTVDKFYKGNAREIY